MKQLENLVPSVPRQTITDFITALGVEPFDVRRLTITHDGIELAVMARAAGGTGRFISRTASDGASVVALHRVFVPVDSGWPTSPAELAERGVVAADVP